jgi:hypothetical protein
MKLYVCWGTFPTPRPGGHPCRNAYQALKEAGYEPEVEKVYGLAPLPDTPGRKRVRALTGGNPWVPVLVTDSGETIQDSKKIADWARRNPAGAASTG